MHARDFQNVLFEGAEQLFGAAGSESPKRLLLKPHPSEAEIDSLLKAAAVCLKKNPELLSGDPRGIFTYEDPVLAAAIYYVRKAEASHRDLYGCLLYTSPSPRD